MGKNHVCASCEEPIRGKDSIYRGESNTLFEGKPLCETCFYDSEPIATIFYGRDKEPHHITLARNETEGDYKATWHSTDPWRGYFELSSTKYATVFSDAILAYHESEGMLEKLNDRALDEFDSRKIEYARSFARTSNVFSTGYDIWVRKQPEQIVIAHLTLEQIKKEVDYGNPLYSTGIVMDREAFGKLQGLLKGKYEISNDRDLMNLAAEQGEELLNYVQSMYQHGDGHGN
jgi:hypothetical protein